MNPGQTNQPGPMNLKITLVHGNEEERNARDAIIKNFRNIPFLLHDIVIDSDKKWSVNNGRMIELGLAINKRVQDILCLLIHEQLHSWDKTRNMAWIEFVSKKYKTDIDPEMNQFTKDVNSCFAQHLAVIWNAFNLTKYHFDKNYIKPDVAYVIMQKFIRDNWDAIEKDLRVFDLVLPTDKREAEQKILSDDSQASSVAITGNPLDSLIKKTSDGFITTGGGKHSVNGGGKRGYEPTEKSNTDKVICKCAFARNKNVKSFTCLMDNELQRLSQIIQQPASNLYEFYQKLVSNFQCNRKEGVDQCVRDNLVKTYGERVEEIFQNALPITDQIDQMDQWLSSTNIDLLAKQIENNYPQFMYMGIATWDEFEDQSHILNIDSIIKTIQSEPTKEVFGFVLNQCTKFSSGQHWVAMAIRRQGKSITVSYYDSQDKDGPEDGTIECNMTRQPPPELKKKYSPYISKFDDWWDELVEKMNASGLNLTNKTAIEHNKFITQTGSYECGYHAIYFLFLQVTQKEKTIGYMQSQIVSTSPKSLDDFIHDFQGKCFDLTGVK